MWYVIQVRTGTEERIRQQCELRIDRQILTNCFIPYYEDKFKIKGEWQIRTHILFPGYVFAITDRLDDLRISLHSIIGLTKVIGIGDEIVPLTDAEVNLLQKLGGDDQIVAMSEGIIEGGKAMIYKGPLTGMEGCIRKINRHSRKAWIEIEMFGSLRTVEVGLEIVAKK